MGLRLLGARPEVGRHEHSWHAEQRAFRAGLLLAQLDDGPPRSCSIAYRGEIAARNTRLVTAAFAAGLLESASE
ncbi:MAG: hypothetical protein ACKOTB_01920, partial [Planctomycetia bacterium]